MARKKTAKKTPKKKSSKKTLKKKAAPTRKLAKLAPTPAQSVLVHLAVSDGVAAMDFYRKAFGAKEISRLVQPGGKLAHAEFKIGNTVVILADEQPQYNVHSPLKFGGSPVTINYRVRDCDAAMAKALAAGGRLAYAIQTDYSGMRMGAVEDPFGYTWFITAQLEKITPRESQKRFNKLTAGMLMPPEKD